MTMKPRAKKFRIRRNPTAAGASAERAVRGPSATPADTSPAQTDTPPRRKPAPADNSRPAARRPETPTQRDGQVQSAAETGANAEIDAIRREGLTGRQLRVARRTAQKHNLPATSDFDAVRLLRKRGIDPFQRTNMLELVVPQGAGQTGNPGRGGAPESFRNQPDQDGQPEDEARKRIQLPQTVPAKDRNLPSTELSPTEQRDRDIAAIQRDINRRRRRKLRLLMARLAFFVMLPTIFAAWYFFTVAAPMYATKSEFLIIQADNMGGAGIGGLLSGTQFATNQDAIAVQSYLQSKEAMLRLDDDLDFKAQFAQEHIDPIQRLAPDATNEEAYKTFKKNIQIGYDPTEGVIRMEVIAPDPQVSAQFSTLLISYAEEMVNNLSQKKREDQMRDALAGFENAEIERRKAQEALVQLQQRSAVLDPEGVIVSLRGQINTYEIQLQEKKLQLAALLDNLRPNRAKVDGARGDIGRLEYVLEELNRKMVEANEGENSLAQMAVRIQMAKADLATRDLMLQSALQQVEQTRMEANRQVRYLTTPVMPVAPQEAAYPRKFENTLLVFLVFAGIYLMISLTVSILREQVST